MLSLLLLMCSGARADEPVMLYEDPLPEALERVLASATPAQPLVELPPQVF